MYCLVPGPAAWPQELFNATASDWGGRRPGATTEKGRSGRGLKHRGGGGGGGGWGWLPVDQLPELTCVDTSLTPVDSPVEGSGACRLEECLPCAGVEGCTCVDCSCQCS